MKQSTKLLWTLSIAQFLIMQVWFNFSSIIPVLESEWMLTATQAGIIIAFFHIGYVLAIIIYSFFLSAYNPKYIIVIGALIAGVSGVLFPLLANGFWTAVILRTVTGIGVAGIYVPGMKLVSQLFPPSTLGKAMGIYVGSLVIGSGFSLLISGFLISSIGWKGVILLTSVFSLIAGFVVFMTKIPQIPSTPLVISKQLIQRVFRKRNVLINGGYAAHCWELYAMWSWIGPFLVYYFTVHGVQTTNAINYGNILASFIIMLGGFASYIGGKISDRFGRGTTSTWFLVTSISYSIIIGWLTSLPIAFMVILLIVYGFSIIADSPIYNTAITEVTDLELTGLALGIQSILGFSATVFAPLFFGIVLDYYSWGAAFTTIGLLSLIAPVCMTAFKRIEKTPVT
ncbi:MFS transporter [Alkalihalobacillus hemicellulosilyticus]|uniref:Major facilitator superfamily MFS_1 n=1 Tax=Halalkalibacter hemicellulosilyticusJCM 9152 TaxID=1236971 RepID=W4QIM5_9BACI|nr:MFS transporter [Halalkalibacter hemicellulosilyticus]GAE31488.1 major facilitator superfamily MFS_1 [Halalkalibacter hemicellulosilyticusJCM 9152]